MSSTNTNKKAISIVVKVDGVMTTALLDRLLHHARVFNLNGESYRIHRRKEGK
jgi:DNA replication protein DnaC